MYVRGSGAITASELIARLQEVIKKHGDLIVFSGGQDYPEGVHGVSYCSEGDAYVLPNSFVVY